MIKRTTGAACAADLTRTRRSIPGPVPAFQPRPRTRPLVPAHAAGHPAADHRRAHLPPAAHPRYALRRGARRREVLHLHGLGDAAVGAGLGGALAGDPRAAHRRALAGGVGRCDQGEDRHAGVCLPAPLRPCRQDPSQPLAVGADPRHGRAAEGPSRARVRPAVGLRRLPAPVTCAGRRWRGAAGASAVGRSPSRPSSPKPCA